MYKLSQNPPICPDDQTQNKHQWCAFQVNDPVSAASEYIYFFCIIILLIVLIRFIWLLSKYRKSNRYKQYFGNVYVWVYKILALWLSYAFIRASLSIIVYNVFMRQDFPDKDKTLHPYDPQITSAIVACSSAIYFLNSLGAYIINLVLLSIPYLWIRIQFQIVKNSSSLEEQDKDKIKTWTKVINFTRIYCKYIRNFFLFLLIVQIIMFYSTQFARCRMNIVNLCFIVLESVLLLMFYIFCAYVSFYLHKRQLVKFQSLKIKIEFIALFIVSIARFIRILFITLSLFISSKEQLNGNCSNLAPDFTQHVLFLIFLHGFLHILPICIILYIYQPSIKKLRKYEDLMDIDSGSNVEGQTNYRAIARNFYKSSLSSVQNQTRNIQEERRNSKERILLS